MGCVVSMAPEPPTLAGLAANHGGAKPAARINAAGLMGPIASSIFGVRPSHPPNSTREP